METETRFDKLLDSCREMAMSHLRPLLDRMFENSDVALLSFAEKAESNMTQALFFDAMNEVRKKRPVIEKVFFQELRQSFSDFPVSPAAEGDNPESGTEAGGLSLVDTEELEESVATQNAVRKLTSNTLECVFALKQRLSIVNHGNAVTEKQIPGGPAWLGAAFQKAVDELELETRVRLVIIALFDKYVLGKVHDLFDEYNDRLIQAGILPNLKYEVRKNPANNVTPLTQNARDGEIPGLDDGETDSGEDTSDEIGDELFDRICGLLSVQHGGSGQAQGPAMATGGTPPAAGNVTSIHAGGGNSGGGGPAAGGGVPGGAMPASGGAAGYGAAGSAAAGNGPSVLVSQISHVQSQVQSSVASVSSSEFIENIEIDDTLIDRLQNTLSREREKIFGPLDRRKLPAADNNVIELVGMLFEFMLKEENLPNVAKALLSRLHTPMLKVAVLDRTFFTNSKQPARKLLNDMISAGNRWVDEQQLERGIFPTMKETVDRVLADFHEDASVFDGILSDFSAGVEKLKRRASIVEQRTNEAADGQEKLLAARQQAQEQIREITAGRRIDTSANEFLSQIWSDKLTFIVLRSKEGTESAEWRDAVALADRIVASTSPPPDEDDRRQRKAALGNLQTSIREASRNLQQGDKEKLLGKLFNQQQATLQGMAAEPVEAPQPEKPAQQPAPEADDQAAESPEIAQAIIRLKNVDFGAWFEFSKPDSPVQKVKLSWHSTITEKFMFVDQMGVKVAIIPTRELAELMVKGYARILKTDRKPFVGRALSAIHRVLDQRSKATANA